MMLKQWQIKGHKRKLFLDYRKILILFRIIFKGGWENEMCTKFFLLDFSKFTVSLA